jgi:hypothetical protein
MYTIYHILGVKVGCTKNFQRRCLQNKRKYGDHIEIEILEQLDDSIGDGAVGDLELKWSKSLGYGRSTHYTVSNENLDGAWNWKGRKGFSAFSEEEAKLRRGSGLWGSSKEEHIQNSSKGGKKGFQAQYALGKHPFQNSEVQSRNAKRAAELGRGGMKKIVECPHCHKSGTAAIMGRWHFDKCKLKNSHLLVDYAGEISFQENDVSG